MDLFLGLCAAFAIYLFGFILTIKDNKTHPPFIEKGKTGKKDRECYSVSVWRRFRGSGDYVQYDFVKRKNGKYRSKFVFDWIMGLLFLSFYICIIWLIGDSLYVVMEYPKIAIAALGIFLLFLCAWACSCERYIIARIYFHKYMKTQ